MLTLAYSQPELIGCACGLGDLAGAAEIQAMQNVLAQVSTSKGDYKYHPYRSDGVMSMGTVAALFNVAIDLKPPIPVLSNVFVVLKTAVDAVLSIPLVGDIVKKLLHPGTIDVTISVASALNNPKVNSVLSALNSAKAFIESNAGVINTGLAVAFAAASPQPAPPEPPVTVPSVPGVTPTYMRVDRLVMPTQADTQVPAPGAAPAPALAPTYPPGSVTAYDPAIGKWRIASPLAGLWGACGLGQAPTHGEQAPSPTKPGLPEVTLQELKRKLGLGDVPLYKKWWFWTAIGGTAVLGTAGYFMLRRKRTPAPASA